MIEFPVGMEECQTPIIDAIQYWAQVKGDEPAITFLTYAGRDRMEEPVSYRALKDRVDAFGSALEAASAPGDHVGLLMGQSIDYLVAFLGCLRVGRVAIPLYALDGYQSASRVWSVLGDANPTVLVVDRGREDSAGVGGLSATVLTNDHEVYGAIPSGSPRTSDETAYLQYTSGSTREPAGVMVSTGNFAHGSSQLRTVLGIGSQSTLVTWLPYFHDMGLLLGAGAALQSGAHSVHLTPLSFVQQPLRWLRAIDDFGAQVTVVPNFALDLAVDRVAPSAREGLNLSRLEMLGNGSEPVRAKSLRDFTEAYAPYGFDGASHGPGYGLAEATLTVTTVPRGIEPAIQIVDRDRLVDGQAVAAAPGSTNSVELVSNGLVVEQKVRIVDPNAQQVLSDGFVGEVWVQGHNVCQGYLRRPDQTVETFGAIIQGEDGTWLRTGDLGLLLNGQLYVVGRIKDLIIVAGKNHYPIDIEATVVEEVPEVRANGVAAFAHVGEQPVAVVEVDPKKSRHGDMHELASRIRIAVSRHHELSLHDVVLVRPGAIPKTTSGKIQRRASARLYADGEFSKKELRNA